MKILQQLMKLEFYNINAKTNNNKKFFKKLKICKIK